MNDGLRIVIPCGSKKADEARPAADLYLGRLFKAGLNFARSLAPDEHIRIISAKWGFLRLDSVIEPYEIRFGMRGSINVDALRSQAASLVWGNCDVLVCGGIDYSLMVRAAIPHARSLLSTIKNDLGGTGIGYQLKWLSQNRGRVPGADEAA